jgi:hypothetical protein
MVNGFSWEDESNMDMTPFLRSLAKYFGDDPAVKIAPEWGILSLGNPADDHDQVRRALHG